MTNVDKNSNVESNNDYSSIWLSLNRVNLDDFSMDDLNNIDSPSEITKPEAKKVNSSSGKPQDKVVEQETDVIKTDKYGQKYTVKKNLLPLGVKIDKQPLYDKDWKVNIHDFLRDNKEITTALLAVTLRFRETIDNIDDFQKLMKMSKFPDLWKENVNYLYDFIQKWELQWGDLSKNELAEKVRLWRESLGDTFEKNKDNTKLWQQKLLQIIIGSLKPEFINKMKESGWIDGYIWDKTIDALTSFLRSMETWYPIFNYMPKREIEPIKNDPVPIEIKEVKDDNEVWKIVFPNTSKWSLFGGTISVATSVWEGDNKWTMKNIDQNNNELTEAVLKWMSSSEKPIEVWIHYNDQWWTGASIQLNSEWFQSEVKNRKENMITQNELKQILDNATKFVDKYVVDNILKEWEELNFELQPQIHTEKKVIKFKVKREWNLMNIYMDDQKSPIDSRLREWSVKWMIKWQNWVDVKNGQRTYDDGSFVATKVEIEKPLSENISYIWNVWWMYYDAWTQENLNLYRDFWSMEMAQWVRLVDKKNTISIDWLLTANRLKLNWINDMDFWWKVKLDYHPEDSKLSGNGYVALNKIQWFRWEANLWYKINDKIKLNTWVMYNNAIETPWIIQGMDKWVGKAWFETQHIVASWVFNKSYQGVALNIKF